jgi:hypothetical protein
VAHCVISSIVDSDEGYALVPTCIVHASHAPCMHDGEPANPAPLHMFNHQDRDAALRAWRLRTHGHRPLIIHDEQRVPDPADHVIEDRALPCPCGAEVLAAEEGARR